MLPEMDYSSAKELARWLAYHLTNTKMAWPYWDHWAGEAADGTQGE
jgi:hypothetical protein